MLIPFRPADTYLSVSNMHQKRMMSQDAVKGGIVGSDRVDWGTIVVGPGLYSWLIGCMLLLAVSPGCTIEEWTRIAIKVLCPSLSDIQYTTGDGLRSCAMKVPTNQMIKTNLHPLTLVPLHPAYRLLLSGIEYFNAFWFRIHGLPFNLPTVPVLQILSEEHIQGIHQSLIQHIDEVLKGKRVDNFEVK